MMTRTIKLQALYTQGKWESIPRKYPKLTLTGKWLQDAGFYPYKKITVAVENGRLVIIPSEDPTTLTK